VFVVSGKELVEVDRATGAEKGRASFAEDAPPDTTRVVVGAAEVFVCRGAGAGAPEAATLRFERSGMLDALGGLPAPSGLATTGSVWVAPLDADGKRRLCLGESGSGGTPFVLAGDGRHEEFASGTPTFVAGAAYVGLRAFAFPSLSVLRSASPAVAGRAVPVRDRLLVLESPTTLSCWREARRGDDAPLVGPSAKGGTLKDCRAAIDDGRVLEGPFSFDPKGKGSLRPTKPGSPAPCAACSVQAVLTNAAPRRLLLASRGADAAAGASAILRAEAAASALGLASTAVAAGDLDLARRALASAVEFGAADGDVARVDEAVGAAEAAVPARDEAKVAEVESSLEALVRRDVDVLVEVAEQAAKDVGLELAAACVRAALQRDPEHEGAKAWVRSRLPKELAAAEGVRAEEWLDFLEVRGRLKVRVWGVKPDKHVWGSEGDAPSEDSDLFHQFWDYRCRWPDDIEVVAFECGPVVVVAPLERPGSIARCLALGRLVADTLDKTFESMGTRKTDDEKMFILLFAGRQQYLDESRTGLEIDRKDGLENTAGHYSPSENVTRMFFPGGGDDVEVPGVFAHELTHHWIERRRPAAAGARGDSSSSTPGYWVVEGFADFVRGFVFDVEGRRAQPENPRSRYVDRMSGIAAESLIPWPSLLTMTQEQFAALSVDDPRVVPQRFQLGPPDVTVPKVLFYDQGAAVCAYLYLAEDGKHRKALLDFVYAYYGGTAKADTLTRAIGVAPEELGRRVVAWCRELAKKG
jgi:hypothetical protein